MPSGKILIADDHAIVRAGIRTVVEEIEGLEVVGEVHDGPSLLESLHAHQPDCLLVDISMPEFNPLKTLPEIRAQYPDIKILVVSVYDDEYYVHELLQAGVNGYHLKDQPLSDLKLALIKVLEGDRWISGPLITKLVGGAHPKTTPPLLTLRQREILHLLKEGYDNQNIALQMSLSVKTVENHLTRMYRQLGVNSRLEAAHYVGQHPEVLGVSGREIAQQRSVDLVKTHGLVILLVDDNPRYLQQLQRVLGKVQPQANLFQAESSSSAVLLAQRLQPQLVLVDVVLGEEDGILCAKRVKAVCSQTRIIMISAYPDREFHRLSIEAGAVAFLDKKDLDARTLRHVVEDLAA
jgi:DNA-binding NarL/FixJ family response regulator